MYTSSTTFRIIYGECTWSRTRDLRIKNPLLYLLSYTFVVVSPEFESGTARLSSVCSTAELWNVNWKALIDSNYRIMESKSIVLTNFTKCPLKDYKNLLILYLLLNGLPGGVRSHNLYLRRVLLYPIELPADFTYSYCSHTWVRTRDLRINSPSLYQLSYARAIRINFNNKYGVRCWIWTNVWYFGVTVRRFRPLSQPYI